MQADLVDTVTVPDDAIEMFTDALPRFQRIGDESCIAICGMHIGEFELDRGDRDMARNWLAESLEGFSRLENTVGMASVARRLAELAGASSDWDQAACLLAAAETLRLETEASVPAHNRHRVERLSAELDTSNPRPSDP